MLATDQARFLQVVTEALRAYGKKPEKVDLEDWWHECRGLSIEALEAALKAHKDDPERGERAPRPVDITRRMKAGNRESQGCAAVDSSARCAYPGIFSDGTQGEGSWWCPLHRIERVGPEASKRIEYSHNVSWEDFRAKQGKKRAAEVIKAPAVVQTAWDIAKRHGNRPWQANVVDFIPEATKDKVA